MMENNGQSMAEIMKDLYRKSYREAAKVIVAGGRDFTDYEFMKESLGHLFAQEDFCGDSDIKIISGMADGADTLAIRFADEFELTKILFPANWKLHHRMAGFLRNEDMMEIATHLVAFWDGKSKGTQHIIELAKNKGIPYRIFIYNQKYRCVKRIGFKPSEDIWRPICCAYCF